MIDTHPQGSRAQRIHAALAEAFHPVTLEVEDESHRHAGHAGAQPGGQTHYRVRMVAEAFRGQSRLDRQRAANAVLAAEFGTGLHALSLVLRAPDEPG